MVNAFIATIVIFKILCGSIPSSAQQRLSRLIQPRLTLIAHGLGEINKQTVTNSLEALTLNYGKYDFFEVDLVKLNDGSFVCIHGIDRSKMMLGRDFKALDDLQDLSQNEFRQMASQQDLTACTLEDLANVLQFSSRKRLIVDLKSSMLNKNQASSIPTYKEILNTYPALRDKIILQIYNKDDLGELRDWSTAPPAVLATYRLNIAETKAATEYLKKDDVEWVAMYLPYFLKGAGRETREKSIPVFVHTINSVALMLLASWYGAEGIYTDRL